MWYIVTDKRTFDTYEIGQELWSVTPSPVILRDKREEEGECRLIFDERIAGSRPYVYEES